MKKHVFGCLLQHSPDTQKRPRDQTFAFNFAHPGYQEFQKSLVKLPTPANVTIFHDFPIQSVPMSPHVITPVMVEPRPDKSPYDYRWELYSKRIPAGVDLDDLVILTDVTDVRFLNDPFAGMMEYVNDRLLFINDQPKTLRENKWMRERYVRHLDLTNLQEVFGFDTIVLNAGFVAGRAATVIELINNVLVGLKATENERLPGDTDMVTFNWAARGMEDRYAFRIVHGRPVNTPFRSGATSDKEAWIAHK